MLRSLVFLLSLLLLSSSCFSQEEDIKTFIKAWSVSDRTQTEKAEATYQVLRDKYNFAGFLKILKGFDSYKKDLAEPRLEARFNMFDVLGKRIFSAILTKEDSLKVGRAIRLAIGLKDDQLLGEIYALAADINLEEGYLLYNLKALELQKKIGYPYFSFVQNRFFGASAALYGAKDYKQSIKYGLQCLAFKNVKVKEWDPMVYIFQLDIIGASYLALKDYKKSITYYNQIIDTVTKKPISEQQKELWLGIANGNIGRCLLFMGKEKQALPLINKHLAVAIKYKQPNNIAIAENARGDFFLKQKEYELARRSFNNALLAATQSLRFNDKVKATEGLVKSYVNLGNKDSILFYTKLHSRNLLEEVEKASAGKFSAMNSKIAFDRNKRNLEDANLSIAKLKFTRNIIIGFILVLIAFAWMLYNRQTLKNKLEKQRIVLENINAKAEVDKAKNSLLQFRSQMIEKDRLIANLRQSLQKITLDDEQLNKKLLAYVLVTDNEWMKFKDDFNKVYPLFYPRLKAVLVNLSSAEERLASLIFLQLDNKEIAGMLGISADSVARSKRRLKLKLLVLTDQTLEGYILSLV